MPRELKIALLGFGNVGRRFAAHLGSAYVPALRREGLALRLTGVFTRRHGAALDPGGLDPSQCLSAREGRTGLTALHVGPPVRSSRDFVDRASADVLVELSPLDPHTGQPALGHVRRALERGLHVVTANKGPVAFGYRRLSAVADRTGRRFLFEGAVMDGIPVFNLVARCLPGARVLSFAGTLNGTTSLVLSALEEGGTLAAGVAEARRLGMAEADPRHDLDGWDAAVKGCALANVLLGADLRPRDVRRTGLRGVTPARVAAARVAGRRIRLVTRGAVRGRTVSVRVRPEELPLSDPLARPGTDAVLQLRTDLAGELSIHEGGGTVDQTAYAVLSDLLAIHRAPS